MQLKVIWDLYLHTDPEGPPLISNTALRFGSVPSRIRDTLAACNQNRAGSQSTHFLAQLNCGLSTVAAQIICEPACNRCPRLAIHDGRSGCRLNGCVHRNPSDESWVREEADESVARNSTVVPRCAYSDAQCRRCANHFGTGSWWSGMAQNLPPLCRNLRR
jgi:hypothetical protein